MPFSQFHVTQKKLSIYVGFLWSRRSYVQISTGRRITNKRILKIPNWVSVTVAEPCVKNMASPSTLLLIAIIVSPCISGSEVTHLMFQQGLDLFHGSKTVLVISNGLQGSFMSSNSLPAVAYESSHVTQEAIPVGCRDFLLLIRDAEDLDWAGELLSAELPVISRYVSLNYYYFHVIS